MFVSGYHIVYHLLDHVRTCKLIYVKENSRKTSLRLLFFTCILSFDYLTGY